MAELKAEKKPEVTATTINSLLNNEEPWSRWDVKIDPNMVTMANSNAPAPKRLKFAGSAIFGGSISWAQTPVEKTKKVTNKAKANRGFNDQRLFRVPNSTQSILNPIDQCCPLKSHLSMEKNCGYRSANHGSDRCWPLKRRLMG